jgi:membrane associated rhomboid family serine protease
MHGVQALSAPAMLGPSVRPLQVPLDLPLYVPQHNSRSCWLEAGWARDAAEERQARRPVAGSAGLRLRGGSQRDWLPPALAKLPVITRSIILFNLAIFLLGVAAPDHPIVGGKSAIRTLGFAPQELLQPGTITPAELGKHAARFVGHAFTHASLLHVAFNMLSLSSIGASLEFLIGSSSFLFLVGKMLLATPLVIIAAEVFLRFTSGPPLISGSMVGFSGVLFALFTLHTMHNPHSLVNIFGHPVPAPYAPLALLGVQSLLFPHASFWGHAAGIAAGALYSRGLLNLAVPAAWGFAVDRALRDWDGFVRHTGVELAGSLRRGRCNAARPGARWARVPAARRAGVA